MLSSFVLPYLPAARNKKTMGDKHVDDATPSNKTRKVFVQRAFVDIKRPKQNHAFYIFIPLFFKVFSLY